MVSAVAVTAAIAGMPPTASAQTTTRGETYAITRAQGPIVIDGNLNDEGWRGAVRIERWYEVKQLGAIVAPVALGMAAYVWTLPGDLREVDGLIPALQHQPREPLQLLNHQEHRE